MGYGTVDLSRKPKWNVDFVSGMDWPAIPLDNRHCMRFDASDVKVPYELSRLQFIARFGQSAPDHRRRALPRRGEGAAL